MIEDIPLRFPDFLGVRKTFRLKTTSFICPSADVDAVLSAEVLSDEELMSDSV